MAKTKKFDKRTSVLFTKEDLARIEVIRRRENIRSVTAIVRWALHRVTKEAA